MNILITGSSGFIGSVLTKKLKECGHELFLADLSVGVDICNPDHLLQFADIDVVIHLANLSFVPASYKEPVRFYQVNYTSTLNILDFCRINNSRLIYFSSYIYGTPQYQPIDEKHPVQAFNPYAQTKVICESLCEGYSRDFQVPVIVFRPFNIYGTGQNPDFLIPIILREGLQGKITIKDDRPKRDYIHVDDAANAVIRAIEYPHADKKLKIFNLGTGVSHSVKELIDIVRNIYTHKIDYLCTGEIRANEVMDTIADTSAIRSELGWSPSITLENGLRKMIEDFTASNK